MAAPPDSPLGRLYEEHIGFIVAKDIAGLLSQYTEDCLLISTLTEDRQPLYVRGHQQLEDFFRSRIFALEDLGVEINQWAETENALMIVEEVKATGSGGTVDSMEFYDNWYLKDGKIAIHFAGTVRYPDGTYADGTGFPEGAAPEKQDPPDTALGKLYEEHINFIKAKDVSGIVNQYTEEPLLISTLTEGRVPRYVRGREELGVYFNDAFMGLKSLTTRIDQWAETDQALMIVESVDVIDIDDSRADMSFYDNWVLVNGKIAIHYAGVIRYPDGSYT